MGFFDDFKEDIKKEMGDVKKSVQIAQLKSDLRELERQTDAIFAIIGRAFVEKEGISGFGDDGDKLEKLLAKVAEKKAEIREAEGAE
ncbi:MAG TPA: hypothetical protein O0X40_02900 [Methanocorpusculum sp.]|nr:hypothetical protein [Methanocorpusculum sp.]